MPTKASDVRALGAELSGLSDSTVNIYLSISHQLINDEAWGDCSDAALRLMTAHLLTLSTRGGGSGGPVTNEKVGDLSVSYGVINGGDDLQELASTSYGVMLGQLRRAKFFLPFCV